MSQIEEVMNAYEEKLKNAVIEEFAKGGFTCEEFLEYQPSNLDVDGIMSYYINFLDGRFTITKNNRIHTIRIVMRHKRDKMRLDYLNLRKCGEEVPYQFTRILNKRKEGIFTIKDGKDFKKVVLKAMKVVDKNDNWFRNKR
jgi:hypothetical protein